MLRIVAVCVLAATLCTYTRPWGPPLQWKLPSMLESDTRVDACIERPSVLCRVDTSPAIILNTSMEGSSPPPWAATLLDRWQDLAREAASLPAELFVEYAHSDRAAVVPEWRVFALRMADVDVQPFRALAPKAAAVVDELLETIGPGLLNVVFSTSGRVSPRCDGADGRHFIRYQLVLSVPQPAAQFRVCDQGPFLFQEGSLFAFNNSKPHEVINWAEATGLVMIVDVATSLQGLDLHNSITHMRQAFANDLPTIKRLNLMHELWNKFGTDVKQRAKFIEKLRKSLNSKNRVAELWAIANATLGSHGLDWRQSLHVQYGLDVPAQPTRPRPTSSSTAQLAVGAVLIASLALTAHYRMWTIAGGSGVEDRLCTVSYYCQRLAGIALCLVWGSLETCRQAGGESLPGAALWRSMPRPGGLPPAAQLAVAGMLLLVLSRTHSCLLEIGACTFWAVSRTCAAGGLLHMHVPLLGYFRIDLAVVLLAVQGLVVVGLRQLHRRLPLLLVVSLALLSRAALPHPAVRYSARNLPARDAAFQVAAKADSFFHGAFRTQGVSSTPAALSARECERVYSHVLDHHVDWTHANVPAPIPYFSFGLNSNHVAARSSAPAWWSVDFGFSATEGNEGAFALSNRPAYMAHRKRTRSVMRDASWLNEPIRSAFARHLGVSTSQIVFGGEGVISHLYNPAVQIYLPNLAFALMFNPHMDDAVFSSKLQKADGVQCDNASRTALLLPLHTPPGAGLLYWNYLHPDGNPSVILVEHVPSRPL